MVATGHRWHLSPWLGPSGMAHAELEAARPPRRFCAPSIAAGEHWWLCTKPQAAVAGSFKSCFRESRSAGP